MKFHGAFKSPQLVSEIPGHRDRIMSAGHVFVQPKLRGWCGMANTRTRRIYTRSGREITNMPHINAALPTTGPEWLHGEYYVHGFDLDGTDQGMIKRGDGSIEFHVFDCVMDEPFGFRNWILSGLQYNEIVKRVDVASCMTGQSKMIEQVQENYQLALNHGYEGIIIRLDGHGYYHGRSINVFKMKPGTEVI